MATIRILLGFVWLITFGSGWHIERNRLNSIPDDSGYQRIVVAASKDVGVREAGVPNTGEAVSAYLRYVGINRPAPWCAAWVSHVFGRVGYASPKTAWSPSLFPGQRLVKDARPGLVLGIYYPALKRIGHCGIVERVSRDWCMSIEGNTNIEGSREGDGVYRRVRHVRTIHCYADWIKKI